MANNTGYAFAIVVGAWLGVIGVGVIIIGLSGALSGGEMENWVRGIMWVLAISGGLILYGGFNMVIGSKKKMEDIDKDERYLAGALVKTTVTENTIKEIRENAAKPFADKNTILAHWNYTDEEWKEYTAKEYKYRIKEALLLWVLITGLGTWLIASYRDMGHLAAFITSFGVGAVFTLIRFIIAKGAKKANSAKPGNVIISAKSILINGKYHILNDENKALTKLELLNDEKPQILEFSVEWNTRRGRTNEQVRVPVPSEKREEAVKLIELFNTEIIGKY